MSAHPGFAKGKMESAIKALADVLATLPKDKLTPETTSGKEGFIHPVGISGNAERAEAEFIIRDFEDELLKAHEDTLEKIVKEVMLLYPSSTYEMRVTQQYRNMKKVLDLHPQVMEYGVKAIERAGITVKKRSIRGGTDGSRLSFMGLPCPNIFAGEHAFHSKQEWVSVQDMQKATETVLYLVDLFQNLKHKE